MNWDDLIEERNTWITHNFPNRTIPDPGESILGCIEELGELAHADLKERQHIRGTDDQHIEDAKDAVGDLIVYLLGVMSEVGIPKTTEVRGQCHTRYDALVRLSHAVGRLAHMPSSIRVEAVIYYTKKYCEIRNWNFPAIVNDTWREVRERDWIAYPKTGLPDGDTKGEEHDEAADASPA